MKFIFFILTVCMMFISCKSHHTSDLQFETIKVEAPEEITKADFTSFFSSWQLVPLETSKESLIGRIDRISLYKNRYYILDRQTNSLFIFSDNGKFQKSIHNIGQGPGEYIGLMDFAIDKKKQELILHSHRPYRLLFYDLNGTFLRQEKLSTFYTAVSCASEKLIEVNQRKELNSMALVKDLDNGDINKYIPFSKKAEIFEHFGTGYPYIVQSLNTFVTFPFEPVLYQFNKDGIYPKYRVDFGSHNIPETEFSNGNNAQKIYMNASKNWDGISISNVRETKDHICFSYGNSIIVIYSKKTKTAQAFTVALNKKGQLSFQTYFGHDGDDNTLISVYEATMFVKQMRIYKEEPDMWEQVPESMKSLMPNVTENNNPLLLICTLKTD
jgi:hypothetical protein